MQTTHCLQVELNYPQAFMIILCTKTIKSTQPLILMIEEVFALQYVVYA